MGGEWEWCRREGCLRGGGGGERCGRGEKVERVVGERVHEKKN